MAIQENDIVYGRAEPQYTLGKEIGAGGEGRVYKVNGKNLVAKIYKNADPETVEKISYMVDHRISDLSDDDGNTILSLAWPQDILFDQNSNFIGYVMPYVRDGVEICTIARGCDTPKSKALFPDYNWMINLHVAVNLARAVNYLHDRNCIIGDMNCKNIMVAGDCSITILDNDSFDLLDEISGNHYRCCAGTQDYLAPELQGRSLRSPNAIFSVFSDDFSLAIHIFQLLMNNFHPFTGKNLVVIRDSTAVNQRLEHLATGKCPFINTYEDLTIPVGAPILSEMMPQQLVEDFRRTFGYEFNTIRSTMNTRTTAAQWYAHLLAYQKEFRRPEQRICCANNPRHYFLNQLGSCGLCNAEHRLQAFRSQQAAARASGTQPNRPQYTPQQPRQTQQAQQPQTQQAYQPKRPPQNPTPAPAAPAAAASGAKKPNRKRIIGIIAFCAFVVSIMLFGYIMDNYPASSGNSSVFHFHNWVPADYTSPSHCTICWMERGDVKGYLGNISGTWEPVCLNDYNTQALHLSTPIRGMLRMTVNLDVTVSKGSPCTDWLVYLLIDGKWTKQGVIRLPSGSGSGSVNIAGSGAHQVEYVAVLPSTSGPEEFTASITVTGAQEK